MGTAQRKRSKTANDHPEWMRNLGISTYLVEPDEVTDYVLRPEAGFLTEKGRVYWFLRKHSWREFQEYCGRWVKPQRRYATREWEWEVMTRPQIAEALGIKEENLHRALVALEREQLVRFEGKKTFPLAKPAASAPSKVIVHDNFPELSPLFSALDSLKFELHQLRTEFQEARKSLTAPLAEKYQRPMREVKTKIRQLDKEIRKAAGVEAAAGPGHPPKKVIVDDNFSELSPLDRKTEVIVADNEKLSPTIRPSLLLLNTEKGTPPASASLSAVLEALREYSTVADDAAARLLIRECRKKAPDARLEEIVFFIHQKGRPARKADSPLGLLIKAVPQFFEGESFRLFREKRERERAAEERRQAQAAADWEQLRKEQEAVLADPNASAEDKAWARKILCDETTERKA